jgi:hypothetical protein
MSNTERQRRFRERNPGYYGRLHRKRKQELLVFADAQRAALATGLTQSAAMKVAYQVACNQVNFLQAMAQVKRPLMLPAPVEQMLIPGLNAIPTREQMHASDRVTLSADR